MSKYTSQCPLCGRSGVAINSVSFLCVLCHCMQAVGPCLGVNKLGETRAWYIQPTFATEQVMDPKSLCNCQCHKVVSGENLVYWSNLYRIRKHKVISIIIIVIVCHVCEYLICSEMKNTSKFFVIYVGRPQESALRELLHDHLGVLILFKPRLVRWMGNRLLCN